MSKVIVAALAVAVAAVSALTSSRDVPESRERRQEPQGRQETASYQGWATSTRRQCARLFYYRKIPGKAQQWGSSPGEVAIEYGLAPWKPGYFELFKKQEHRYWRLGMNHWTNLDARLPVVLGGVTIERGYYYLALHLDAEERWFLELLDPDKMAVAEIDAWHINRQPIPAGVRVPLQMRTSGAVARNLDIRFVLTDAEKDPRRARLEIRFGPYELTASALVRA